MGMSDNHTKTSPTQRLLEIIRSKGHTHSSKNSAPSKTQKRFQRKLPAPLSRKHVHVGLEFKDDQLITVSTLHSRGDIRLLEWQIHEFPAPLQTRGSSSRLKALLVPPHAQGSALKGHSLEYWVSYEFSREEFYHLTLPPMKRKDLPTALEWTLRRQYELDLENTVLDFEILGQVAETSGTKEHILAVVVDKQEVQALQRVFSQAGISLSGITPSGLAGLNLFRSGCISTSVPHMGIVHIGLNSSSIDIVDHHRLLLHRRIRTGLKTMLQDVQTDVPLSGSESQEIKVDNQVLSSVYTPDSQETWEIPPEVCTDIDPALTRFIRQIERTISYSTRNLGHPPVERLYLTGSPSASEFIQSRFAQILGLDITTLDAFQGSVSLVAAQPRALSQRLQISSTIGLSLSSAQKTLNFIHTFVQKAWFNRLHHLRVAAIAFVLCVLMGMAGYHAWQTLRLNHLENRLHAQQKQAQHVHSRLEQIKKSIAKRQGTDGPDSGPQIMHLMQAKYSTWRQYAKRFKPVACIAEIFSLLPEDARLQTLFAYLQPHGPPVALRVKRNEQGSGQHSVYTSRDGSITLNRQARSQKNLQARFQTLFLLEGMITGQSSTKAVQLSRLEESFYRSSLFQVVESMGESRLHPDLGQVLHFYLLITLT